MKKLIPLTALALGLTGGVALADRGHETHRSASVEHRGNWNHGTTTVVRDHGNFNRGNWNHGGNNYNYNRGWNGGNRVVINDHYGHGYGNGYGYGYGYARRPIYGVRPIIRERYYDYYQRPALITESYNAQPGYFWVAGAWAWNGSEWIWQQGHYQPDPSYSAQAYAPGYDQGATY